MLCRRCGLESTTTDTCEWCKKPMLPSGATVSKQATEELKKEPPTQSPEMPPQDVGVESPPPMLNGSSEEEPQKSEETAVEEGNGDDVLLRPLGHHGHEAETEHVEERPKEKVGGTEPTHGLTDDATKTSIDISQYMGAGESIFRPIKREESQGSDTSTLDAIGKRRHRAEERKGPEMSENQRLVRCLIVGVAVAVVFSLAQFFITGGTQTNLYGWQFSRSSNFIGAIQFGVLSGMILGFGLGALLVRFKKGSFMGILAGAMVGWSLANGIWGIMPGIITGIFAGHFATIGVRRVINV